uniref:LsmAD domain-containing protein n=1 Tax=Strongyloides stercoralis TaxID=6248 RepID=A0A0K0E6J4_STRER
MPLRQSTENNDSRNKCNSVDVSPGKVDGVYTNGEMVRVLTFIHGRETKILTTDGEIIEGVFSSASENCDVAVRLASEESKKGKNNLLTLESDVVEKMQIGRDSIVSMTFDLKSSKDGHTFATDLDYSKRFTTPKPIDSEEKEFVEWDGGDEADDVLDVNMPTQDNKDHLYNGKNNKELGWSVDDMFKKNNDLGVKSTFEGSEGLYTTVEVVGNHEDRIRAEELAKEIESNVESRKAAELENDDEEKNIIERKPAMVESNDIRNSSNNQKRPNGHQRNSRNGPLSRNSGQMNKNNDNFQNTNNRGYGNNRDGRYQPPQKQQYNNSQQGSSTQNQQQSNQQQSSYINNQRGQDFGNKYDNKQTNMSGNRTIPRNNSGNLSQNNYNRSSNQEGPKGVIQRTKDLNNQQQKKSGDGGRSSNYDNNTKNNMSSMNNSGGVWNRAPPSSGNRVSNNLNELNTPDNSHGNKNIKNEGISKKDNTHNDSPNFSKKDNNKGSRDVSIAESTTSTTTSNDNNKKVESLKVEAKKESSQSETVVVKERDQQQVQRNKNEEEKDSSKKSETIDTTICSNNSSSTTSSTKSFKFNVDAPAFVPSSTINTPSSPSNIPSPPETINTNPVPTHIPPQPVWYQPAVFQGGNYMYGPPTHTNIQHQFYTPYPPQHPTGINSGNPQIGTYVVGGPMPIPQSTVNQGNVVQMPVQASDTNTQAQGNPPTVPPPIQGVSAQTATAQPPPPPPVIHPQATSHYPQHNIHPGQMHHPPPLHRYDGQERRDKKPKNEYRNKDRDHRDYHGPKRDDRYHQNEAQNIPPPTTGYPGQMIPGYTQYSPYAPSHIFPIPYSYFPANTSINQQTIPPISGASSIHYQIPSQQGVIPQQPIGNDVQGSGSLMYNNSNPRQGNQNTGHKQYTTGDNNITNDSNSNNNTHQRHTHSPESVNQQNQQSRPTSPKSSSNNNNNGGVHRSSPTLSTTSQHSYHQPQQIVPMQQYVMPPVCQAPGPMNVPPGQGTHFNMAAPGPYQHPQGIIPGNNMMFYPTVLAVQPPHYQMAPPRRNSISHNGGSGQVYNNGSNLQGGHIQPTPSIHHHHHHQGHPQQQQHHHHQPQQQQQIGQQGPSQHQSSCSQQPSSEGVNNSNSGGSLQQSSSTQSTNAD